MGVTFRWPRAASETHWTIRQVALIGAEPLSLAEAKVYLKVEHDVEDAQITSMITAARQQVEADTGILIVRAEYDFGFDAFTADGVLRIPRAPLSSVTSVTWYDSDDVATVIDPGEYFADSEAEPPRVLIDYTTWPWPNAEIRTHRAGVIRFIGGPADAAPTPAWAIQAVRLKLADMHVNRSGDVEREQLRVAYDDIIGPRRLPWVA